jgi:hypothetical protein
MALVMWATQPSHECVPADEPRRHLYLDRQLDREHLQRDALKLRAVARRYASGLSSQSVEGEIAKCEETLARHLAAAHDVPVESVFGAMSVEP